MTKEALEAYYTTFDGFYSQYFEERKILMDGQWQVRCPFHDDKKPSMTVSPKTGLFYCHGCGKKGSFIDFYMSKHGRSFPEAIKEMCADVGINEQKPKIVKTYDYRDANGNFVSQTVRYEPKRFSQRTKRNGQWVWSLKGVKTVLYNLEAVINAGTVLVMDGEKDCDTAAE